MQSSATEPAAALESLKAGLSGCCSSLIAQDDTLLHPLADNLAAQTSHKRGSTAQPMSRNVSLRSVRFSLELERPTSAEADPSESAAAGSFSSCPSEPSAVSATQQASSASPATSAVLNSVPLVAVGMDYSFTERGALPEGLEASGLATAFGPEPRADEAPQPDGVSARIQVGDALVALLEHHHKHRYAVATADPDEVAASKGFSGGTGGDEPVELDRRARSLTRSLARSASSSPLVQLLAMHRKRRENLTGWQDDSSVPLGDNLTPPKPVPFPPPSIYTLPSPLPAKLQMRPDIARARLGEEVSALVAASRGASSAGSGPQSLRGPSSVQSMHSSSGSSSAGGSVHFAFSAPSSVAGSGSSDLPARPEAAALAGSQCPGCGSMTQCCCKDMDLAGHPSLEGSLETGVELATSAPSQSSSESTSKSALLDAPSAQSSTIRKMLAAQLTDQASLAGATAGSGPGSTTPQKIIEAARGASFNEVLARCLSLGSESASPGSKKAAAGDEQIIAPFIPIDASSLDKLDLGQAIKPGKTSRWSFDSALLPQYVHGRPNIVERRSMDGASVSVGSSGEVRPSYTSLMAAYRERLGMSSTSSSLATSNFNDVPAASDAISGALKQALRSQLTTPASSRRGSEDTPSSAVAAADREEACPSQRNSSEQPKPPQPACLPQQQLAQLALSSQLFGSLPPVVTALPQPPQLLRRCSSERRRSGSWLPTVDESPPAPSAAESPVSLAPHDAAAAAKARLFHTPEDTFNAVPGRHSFGGPPVSWRPPMSPRRMSTSDGARPGASNEPARTLEALGLAGITTPRRLSCARSRSNAQQAKQRGADAAQAAVAAVSRVLQRPSQEAARPQRASSLSASAQSAPGTAKTGDVSSRVEDLKDGQKRQVEAPSDTTAGVLAAVALQLAVQGDDMPGSLSATASPAANLSPLFQSLRPLRVPSTQRQQPAADPRQAANTRELSLAHLVQDATRTDSGSSKDTKSSREISASSEQLLLAPTHEAAMSQPSPAQMCASAPAAAAAAEGRPGAASSGAASRGAAARALFSMGGSADAASRAVVRSMGRSRNGVREGAGVSLHPSKSEAFAGIKDGVSLSGAEESLPAAEAERPRRTVTFSPGTPPVRSEPAPFSPERLPDSFPLATAEEASRGPCGSPFVLGGPAAAVPQSTFWGHPALSAPPSAAAVPAPGKLQHLQPLYNCPARSGSHELQDTYGAHRVRAETVRAEQLRCGSGSQTRLGLGLMPPSAMWVEHRAGAHVTPVLHHRGHFSMDAIRDRPHDAFSPASGLLPFPHPVFEGTPENMEKQRRDSYLARTLSNMARAKLDHAMALAAEKDGPPEKWEMSFTDDGPEPTFGHTSGSEEGAISRAKRMMAEAAAAHPSHAYFTDGNIARRDADGITALLDVLATPKTGTEMQERALSTLAFLATSAANAKILLAANGVAVLVPLLGTRSDGVVIAAGGILRRLLPLPNGQGAFVEENGLAILTSLLSASKSKPVLLTALRTLICLTEGCSSVDESSGDGASLVARCGAVPAAVRLACPAAYGGDASSTVANSGVAAGGAKSGADSGVKPGSADPVPLAALALLLKLAGRPELRSSLRAANLMSALAAMMVPGAPEALLSPAIQLTAMLASDMAAAAEFAARGGVIGLMALVSDGGDTEGVIAVQAAAVLGCLVQCSRARSAVWAAGGGSTLLPALLQSTPLALSGLLYLMSCLAEFKDLRAELESADAVPMLLDLLATCTDTQIQAATVSLLRIFTRSGKTLCPILEHQPSCFASEAGPKPVRAVNMERRSFDSCQKKQADRKPDMAAPGRSQSLSLF